MQELTMEKTTAAQAGVQGTRTYRRRRVKPQEDQPMLSGSKQPMLTAGERPMLTDSATGRQTTRHAQDAYKRRPARVNDYYRQDYGQDDQYPYGRDAQYPYGHNEQYPYGQYAPQQDPYFTQEPEKPDIHGADLLAASDAELDGFFWYTEKTEKPYPVQMDEESALIAKYTDLLIRHYTQDNRGRAELHAVETGTMSKEAFTVAVNKTAGSLFKNDGEETAKAAADGFLQFVYGHDILTPLVNDPDITDIRCLAYDNIRYKKFGKRETAGLTFASKEHFERFVKRIAQRNAISLSDQNAVQNFTDIKTHPDFILRYNISTGLVNDNDGYMIHIRKISKHKKDFPQLIEEGMLTKGQAAYLIDAIQSKKSIVVCGEGGAGKTTLLNALIDYISPQTSVVCIQENQELFSDSHPEFIAQHTVINRGERKIQYELKDLGRNSLTADINCFIIGEVKGEEARYLSQSSNTGAEFVCTVHASSAEQAIPQIADYVMYGSAYSLEEALRVTSVGTDLVVFLKDYKLKELIEVNGYDPAAKGPICKHVL